jgi:uncharacterized surface protein with fasciclin (FAS1) repeats
MKKLLRLILIAVFTAGVFSFSGCVDHQGRYDTPDWLGGSSIEILEQRGNYKTFLTLMDRAKYTEPISKQLFTLFVPDDAAFDAYFKSIGKANVDSLTEKEAIQLFTLHVLRNPRSRFQLIYEWVWSELQGPKGEYASLFHRKPTPSTAIPYWETVRYTSGLKGQQRLMYTREKNVSLFTEEFFNDYGGAPDGSDYLFMYPNSEWKKGYPPNLKGMNWHNAMVIPNPEIPEEMEVRTANGFIYFLDRVTEPSPTIEQYLMNDEDRFGVYYDMLQRFARYDNMSRDEQNRVMYRKAYDLIYNLADDRGPSTNTDIPPQNQWSAFIPNNKTLQEYLNNTVLKYYPSLDSVPRVTLYYILQSQLSSTLVLPSKMEKSYFNAFGDATPVSRADVVSRYMTSNGPVYETNRVLEPNVFTCVPGLLFFDKNYTTMLFLLNQANVLSSLANPEADVTLFAPDNMTMEEYGIRFDATASVIQSRGPVDGIWRTMKTEDLVYLAQDHVYKGKLNNLDGAPRYVEMLSGNFIHVGNNKAEAAENQVHNKPATISEVLVNERNGLLVKVDYPLGSRLVLGKLLASELADPDVSSFAKLLSDAKLLLRNERDPDTDEHIPNLRLLGSNKYWTAFIPTNDAMAKAREEGLIPPGYPAGAAPRDTIERFLKYHLVQGTVVFNDGKLSGNFDTNYTHADPLNPTRIINAKLRVINQPDGMILQDLAGQQIKVDPAKSNILFRKGVMHKIDSVLMFYKKK